MNSESLFNMALGLQSPWKVEEIIFSNDDSEPHELHLHIGFESGSRFADESGSLCPVHDTVERQWQHSSFFEHLLPSLCGSTNPKHQKEKSVL